MSDKRSASGSKGTNGAPSELRRTTPGVRTATDYFDEKRQGRAVTRGEMLSFLGSIEWARKQNRWYVRLWRFIRGYPQVKPLPDMLAAGHAETIAAVRDRMLAERARSGVATPDELPIERADD